MLLSTPALGLPYVLIPKSGLNELYWQALQTADKGDVTALQEFALLLLDDSYDTVLMWAQR